MFLNKVINRNPELVDGAIALHQSFELEPDTYVIDLDTTLQNARYILNSAREKNIELYFMTKQIGRNPYIAKELVKMGYRGAVVVDFREAQIMMENNIPLGNVGNLVQVPKQMIKKVIEYGVEVITVFTIEKCLEINEIAKSLNLKQDVILRVYSDSDQIYPGQEGGFNIQDLAEAYSLLKNLKNIEIVGVTSFPTYLFNEAKGEITTTENYNTVMKAVEQLKKLGVNLKQINLPSTTSVYTLNLMKDTIATHGEPGHGLTGTTPAHAILDLDEIPSVVYISEVSHNYKDSAFCYGGGYYRRSHVKNALIDDKGIRKMVTVNPLEPTNIDYTFKLSENCPMSATVVMAFRFQIFVTRSKVAIVSGIKNKQPKIEGVFDSQGRVLV